MTYELDLQRICTDVIRVAHQAGALIRDARKPGREMSQAENVSCKKNTADIVTETDQASEELIRSFFSSRYPNIRFVGEESFKAGLDAISNVPTFVVDPIDGTSNFVHGLPEVCVSIGLVVHRKPVIGVVFNPFTSELWTGVRGHGAHYYPAGSVVLGSDSSSSSSSSPIDDSQKRKLPLYPAPLPSDGLRSACIGIEFGSDRQGPNFDLNLRVFTALAATRETGGLFVNSLRCIGSAALAICRVASGQQEAFWECGCWAWDVAAAWCILEEAGGLMVDGHPGGAKGCWPEIDGRRYLAVRPAVTENKGGDAVVVGKRRSAREQQEEFVELFWGTMGDMRSTYGPPEV